VVTFDGRAPGTPPETWAGDARLTTRPPLDLDGVERLLVLAAHPDDETLGAGGLIATAAARGIPVTVVVVTDGAGSHPDSPSHDGATLVALRTVEAHRAVGTLAPGVVPVSLGYPDGAIRENRAAIFDDLEGMLVRSGTLVAAPWRGDGHRDHRVLGEIAAELATAGRATLAEYPIWLWHWGDPGHPEVPWSSFASLSLGGEVAATKQRALAHYASQIAALSEAEGDESVLHPVFRAHFDRPMELFVLTPRQDDAFRATLRGRGAEALPETHGLAGVDAGGSTPSHVGAAHFEQSYSRRDDPWGVTTRWYERRKRALGLASLPDERYGSAFEIGCSIGVLTEQLAERCDELLAVDLSETAVARAHDRVGANPHVRIEQLDAAAAYPDETFDLVVLSEVGYYLSPDTLETLLDHLEASLEPGGTVLACHWRHDAHDFLQSGDDVHAALDRRESLHRVSHHVEDDFVLDVWSQDARSVAARTGLR